VNLDDWVKHACADAERRNLPQLAPVLQTLARATRVLREADWNADASIETSSPYAPAAQPGSPRS
jgi:hypothetical protein